ncbi:MAG TPA: PLP-dependent transferase [Gaiellales bacterium]|nr:PLP-dependent transferase [Gaiellales bacterium]
MTNRRPETTAARGGRPAQQPGVPAVTPVHRETIYEFESAGQFAEVMADSRSGYLYSRIRNPNTDELAAVVAELEGAEAAHCFASGMAAISAGIDVLAGPGGRVVASRELYGQTYSLLRRRGDTVFVGVDDGAALAAAADGAALVVVETVSNPQLAVADIGEVAAVAHAAGARVLVDNTVATPLGCRPLDLGADLVAHSATKYLNGHSDALAGILAGSAELIAEVGRRALDTGATMAPDTAWLVRRGLRTLHLRLERSAQNAAGVAAFLAAHPRIATVRYPGLASDPQHRVAARVLRGYGGMVTFDVDGGRQAAEAAMDACRLILRATSLGGVESTISHPASTSHRQLSPVELRVAGISDGSLRLSVGIEHQDDLIADLDRALR